MILFRSTASAFQFRLALAKYLKHTFIPLLGLPTPTGSQTFCFRSHFGLKR
jgi:hypothetical protein